MGTQDNFKDTIQETAKGSVILIIAQILSTFIRAISVILIANLLNEKLLGLYTIALNPYNISVLFLDFGINSSIIHSVAQNRRNKNFQKAKAIIKTSLYFKFLVSLILAFLVFYFAPFLATYYGEPEIESLIRVSSISLIGISMMSTTISAFTGYEKMHIRGTISVLSSILKALTAPILIILGFGVMGVMLGNVLHLVGAALLGLIYLYFLLRSQPNYKYSQRQILVELLQYGFPLFLISLLSGGLNRVFNAILPLYVPKEILGNLTATTYFSVIIGFFSIPITTSLFPLFSKYDYNVNSMLGKLFQRSIKYLTLIIYPLIVILILLSEPISTIIYGIKYPHVPFFLKLYMINFFSVGLGASGLGVLLNSQEKNYVNLRVMVVTFLLSALIGFNLISLYGVPGYIINMIVSPIPGVLYRLYWIKKNFGFTIDWSSLLKLMGLSISSFLFLNPLLQLVTLNPWMELIIGSFIVALVFSVGSIILKVIDSEDIYAIKIVTGKLGPLTRMIHFFLDIAQKIIETIKPL